MSWLSEFAGFTDSKPKNKKGMELQTLAPNLYMDNLVKSMLWNGNLKFDDSSSFVKDGYGGNVDVYSIINYVTTTAANVRFKAQVMEGGEWVDDPSSELIKLINSPNPLTTRSLFLEESLGWKLIDGSLYIYAPRLENGVDKGKTLELWTMPSTDMQVVGGGIRKPIEGFRYNSWDETIPSEDVLYQRYFNPVSAVGNLSGSLVGMSPLRAAVLTAQKSNSAAQAGVSAFENNGAMGIVSRASNQYAEFDQGTAKALEDVWKRNNGGANNYNKLAYSPGQIDFNRLNMSPADLRLGESELQAKRQLAAVYKVPTQLLNDAEGATFSNQNEAQKSVYTNTIIPEMNNLAEGFTAWLGEAYYPGVESRIVVDTSMIEVLQQDKAEQVSWLVNADWMTQNEKRMEMGLGADDSEKMDDYLIPTGKMFQNDLDMFNDASAVNE